MNVGKVNLSNPWYFDRKKEGIPRIMVVEYCCIMYMVDYRKKCPLALMHNKIGERVVRGDVVVDLYIDIPAWLNFL